MEKTCTKCGEVKGIEEFAFRSTSRRNGTKGRRSECKACALLSFRQWKEANRDGATEYEREWRRKNRFAHALNNLRSQAKRKGYAPCTATAKELKAAFTGRCAICGIPEAECSKKLAVDHNHESGDFRGFLCKKCNTALGGFGDSVELLVNALHYLMNYSPQ